MRDAARHARPAGGGGLAELPRAFRACRSGADAAAGPGAAPSGGAGARPLGSAALDHRAPRRARRRGRPRLRRLAHPTPPPLPWPKRFHGHGPARGMSKLTRRLLGAMLLAVVLYGALVLYRGVGLVATTFEAFAWWTFA